MLKIFWFKVLIVIALVTATALMVREVFAITDNMSQENVTKGTKVLACASLPSRYSLRIEIVNETGMRLPYTEDGPTGVDGGLLQLLSNYRTCSQ